MSASEFIRHHILARLLRFHVGKCVDGPFVMKTVSSVRARSYSNIRLRVIKYGMLRISPTAGPLVRLPLPAPHSICRANSHIIDVKMPTAAGLLQFLYLDQKKKRNWVFWPNLAD